MWLAWTLIACLGFGAGAAMEKHGVASRLPDLTLRTIFRDWRRILRAMATNWLWLLGIAVNLAGGVFLILAIDEGEISVIQPLVNANVVVAMLAGVVVLRERLSVLEWAGAAVLLGGAALVSSSATGAAPGVAGVAIAMDDARVAWVSAAFVAGAVGLLVAGRLASRRMSAEPFLAVSSGLLYGLGTVWLKVVMVHLGGADNRPFWDTVAAACREWALWALIAANVAGFVLQQVAFSRGRVALVAPMLTIASGLPPVVAGIAALGEPAGALKMFGIVVVAAGTAMLFIRKDAAVVAEQGGAA